MKAIRTFAAAVLVTVPLVGGVAVAPASAVCNGPATYVVNLWDANGCSGAYMARTAGSGAGARGSDNAFGAVGFNDKASALEKGSGINWVTLYQNASYAGCSFTTSAGTLSQLGMAYAASGSCSSVTVNNTVSSMKWQNL